MSLSDFIAVHYHSATAATFASATTAFSTTESWISRVGQGVVVGVSVWLITHGLSMLIKRLTKKCIDDA